MVLLHVVDLDPRLTALHRLGGFFVLRTAGAAGPSPRSLPTLAQAYGPRRPDVQGDALDPRRPDVQGDALASRVRRVAGALRAPEARVAASVAHQGLAARLWSVALGSAALCGAVPDLAPPLLRWDPEAGAPDDLWLSEVRPLAGDAPTLVDLVLRAHLEPLAGALRSRHRLAPGLLRGNAASALAGAARELDRWGRRHGRTDVAVRAASLARDILADPLLAGTGTLTGTVFRRRSCCLYYRVPGGGVCGDCCFVRPPRSSPRAPSE
ncbi:(2Fe-2S)-binding protein [Streptomyces marokkonensis]|uniref:(2Fe-2S)-binding protein n=1 Tax=Streptomyces marokkonensis TaxID=324855 RepID=UPI001FCB1516|nr:(2Fe-2S)-binding protein [Streptomyces marokkonensis]